MKSSRCGSMAKSWNIGEVYFLQTMWKIILASNLRIIEFYYCFCEQSEQCQMHKHCLLLLQKEHHSLSFLKFKIATLKSELVKQCQHSKSVAHLVHPKLYKYIGQRPPNYANKEREVCQA